MSLATLPLVFALVLLAFGVAVLALGVGALFGRRCLRGSCGGAGHRHEDERTRCDDCPNRGREQRHRGAPALLAPPPPPSDPAPGRPALAPAPSHGRIR